MSEFGSLNNEGSGFSLDSTEDLESILGRATAAAEDFNTSAPMPEFKFNDELDASTEEDGTLTVEEPLAEEDFSDFSFEDEVQAPVVEAKTPIESVATSKTEVVENVAIAEPVREQPVEPIPAPAPPQVPPAPVAITAPAAVSQGDSVARIIRIVDAYRLLTPEQKPIVVQFITNGAQANTTDAEFVTAVLNADPMLSPTMKALCEAHAADPVERAFYAMSLSTETLHSLGSLVSVFSQVAYDTNLSSLAFSRLVVAGIAKLTATEISYVQATESVLSALEGSA